MMTETKTRVKTAVLAAVGFLALLIFGGALGATFCSAVIAGAMCFELAQVFYHLPDKKEKLYALLGTCWLTVFTNLIFPKSLTECLVVAFLGMFAYYLAVADRHATSLRAHFDEFVFTVFILVYVVTLMTFMSLLRQSVHGLEWLLLFFLIIWAGDAAAYFVGRKYGRKKLYPLISPGKTVQGAFGGLLAGVFIAVVFKMLGFRSLGWFGAIAIPLAVGIMAQIGDLCESLLKRAYGLKDTGGILPGHGGLLDRFDGVVFSLPVMYLCAKMFAGS